jgi:hypothetical protein
MGKLVAAHIQGIGLGLAAGYTFAFYAHGVLHYVFVIAAMVLVSSGYAIDKLSQEVMEPNDD